MEVFITEDKNLAFLVVSESEGNDLSHQDIIDFLNSNGVVAGLISANIDQIIENRLFGKRVLVAHGRKQVSGRFISVKIIAFEGEEAGNTKPICLGHPGVNVLEGQVVALKIGSGQSGFKVDGEIIKMRMERDVPLPAGTGLRILEEKYLVAEYDGYLVYEDGLLRVEHDITIQGDVDSWVGDIYFVGNTFIKGNIHPNISVYSKGNLSIEGDIDGARIESSSSISIEGNVTNSRILTQEGITAKSVLSSTLIGTKDISLINTTSSFIYCGGRFEADYLLNTQVSARNGVKVDEIRGGTSITIGIDPFIKDRRDEAQQRLTHLLKDKEQLSLIINATREKLWCRRG